jgi:hypothetical protein
MIPAEFFETWPLYKDFNYTAPTVFRELENIYGPINMECEKCGHQTFEKTAVQLDQAAIRNPTGQSVQYPDPKGTTTVVYYTCASCKRFTYRFMFRISEYPYSVTKVGQYPPWSIEVSAPVKKALGRHLPDYKKGLINESQGYGIGAFAYYRRIVEAIIDDLLNDIGEVIRTEINYDDYKAKLATVRGSHSADAKIRVVKDLIPSILRPGHINPLGILHDALSQGIHSQSDEECLNLAGLIRESLVFLIDEVSRRKKSLQDYATSIGTIKQRLDQRGRAATKPK